MTKSMITLVAAILLTGSTVAGAQDAAPIDAVKALEQARAAEAAEAESRAEFRSIDEDVQALKKEVLDLNRDLVMLEEELLFPANAQVAFFLSMDVGEYFDLDSVSIKIDGKEVANYLYSEREVDALMRGGVHRVHMANLKTGEHELIATFLGHGANISEYRSEATLNLDKGVGAKYVELEVTDRIKAQQPEFLIKEWE